MSTAILLCSSAYIKTEVAMNENLEDKYLTTAIREAQELDLSSIIGHNLLEKLKTIVNEGTGSTYPAYKTLLDDYVVRYLGYAAMARVVRRLAYKTTNMGVIATSDEKANPTNDSQIEYTRKEYQSMADAYCRKLQNYLIDNRASYPELQTNTGHNDRPQLYSAASTGMWLGGIRGK